MFSTKDSAAFHRLDVTRQVVTVTAALAQIVLPTLLLPRFRRESAPPHVVQPAPWTFGVWLPVYAASLVHAVGQARPSRRADPALRAAGWPLAVAYGALGVWAPLVSTRRFWAAQVALLVASTAAGNARRRVVAMEQADGTRAVRTLVGPAAALSAWGSAAAGVNLAAMVAAYAPVPPGRGRTILAVATLAALSAVSSTAVRRSGRPTVTTGVYTGVVLWALAGVAAGQSDKRPVAVAAGAATVPLLANALRARAGLRATGSRRGPR